MNAKEASTVKRIAGNILSGCRLLGREAVGEQEVRAAVSVAIMINDEVNRRIATPSAEGETT